LAKTTKPSEASSTKPQQILPDASGQPAHATAAAGGIIPMATQEDDATDSAPLSVEEYLQTEAALSKEGVPSADPETALFNKFLVGNDEAYRSLYDAYERSVFIYCCRLMGSEAEAQDIHQDIWIRMFRLRGERTEVKKFSGLLFTVARNLCLNALRDKKQYLNTPIDEIAPDNDSFVRNVDFEQSDLREMVQKALAFLPFNQREAFVLREYSGYSYQEIADITGASMINVKTRAWRARERLRKVLAAWMDLKSQE
jgi:RNA polymerase sigma-70 factor, ECF subfamily